MFIAIATKQIHKEQFILHEKIFLVEENMGTSLSGKYVFIKHNLKGLKWIPPN